MNDICGATNTGTPHFATHLIAAPAHLPMNELCDLWNQLANVCVSECGGELDEAFLHFEAGSAVTDVWSWFESQNPLFIVGEAGKYIGPAHPLRSKGLVEKALAHVADIHPIVTQVTYDDELRWCFTDSDDVSVVFNGTEDIGLLEDAANDAYLRGLQNVVIKLQTSKHNKAE